MSIIALPDNNLRSIQWALVQPTQVNRSEFTSARQVMQLPGASYWKASAEHVPIKGEVNIRAWRSFVAQLRGQANTFRLPATEGPQHAGANPHVANTPFFQPLNLTGMTVGVAFAQRVAATNGAWAAARSFTSQGEGAELSFSASLVSFGGSHMVGLNTSSNSIAGGAQPQFAFVFDGAGVVNTSVAGVNSPIQTHSAASRYAIRYKSGLVSFYIDGAVVGTAAAPPGATYYGEAAIINLGDRVFDIAYGVPDEDARHIRLCGLPVSATFLPAGVLATVSLAGGGEQLIVSPNPILGDAHGFAEIPVEPMLRRLPAPSSALETRTPWALVAMDSPELSYSVDPGALYGFSFSATEAF